jgi:hypothetical protein
VPDSLIPSAAQRVVMPVITASFLWPFGGRPHPMNRGTPAVPEGPYPAEFGDRFLDAMMREGVPEDEAIRRYLAFDVAGEANLDGRLDAELIELSMLDARAGTDFADFVRDQFRVQNLFATMLRLRLPLFRHVASRIFTLMGTRNVRAEVLMEAPFAPGAMPIHPNVLAHFGMAAPLPDHRYPVLDEGTFTFEHYCRRYLRYEWNERLHAAIALAETNPAEAIPALRLALEISPGSRAGLQALDEAERAVADSSMLAPLSLSGPQSQPAPPPPAAPASAPNVPLYAAVDAALPDAKESSALMPGSLPAAPAPQRVVDAAPVFTPTGLGKLSYPSDQSAKPVDLARDSFYGDTLPPAPPAAAPPVAPQPEPLPPVFTEAPEAPAATEVSEQEPTLEAREAAAEPEAAGFTQFTQFSKEEPVAAPEERPAEIIIDKIGVPKPEPLPEQQAYVELPLMPAMGRPEPVAAAAVAQITPSRYTPLPPAAELIEVLPRMLPSNRGLTDVMMSPFSAMPETMPPPPLRPVLPPELQPENEKKGLLGRLLGR